MAINFWLAQEQAKKRTRWIIVLFIALTLFVSALIDIAFRSIFDSYDHSSFPYAALLFAGVTILVALFNYSKYLSIGGAYVAETVGAYKVHPKSDSPKERMLMNIMQEMSIATTLPVPEVFILENEQINAFAAGTSPENAAICVTTGALNQLSRDELQGVIGHEYGHIYNHDMKLSMKLSAMLMGFYFIFYIAFKIFQFNSYSDSNNRYGGGLVVAMILVIGGFFSYIAGKILSSMISREREYLADASAVQFTRNPDGLIGALKKIQKEASRTDMPKMGLAYNHLYFDHYTISSLFATHPPIGKRIAALEGKTYEP